MWIVDLSLLCLILKMALGQTVLLDIPQGTLLGLKTTTVWNEKPFYSFKSIPYAKPNIGLDKFRAPEPAEGWIGTRDATKFRPFCVQFSPIYSEILGDDDCLFLNVYTPNLDKGAKRAVIVFIHGGGFNFGNGDDTFFGPDFLVEHDLVLVTFNYRLGATGFLNTGDANAPGNAGMRDQVMAMKWVQDYIEYFSGSPTRVTILGEGVGATSVQYHLISPMSQGLFSGAMMTSGTVGAANAVSYTPLEDAHMLADALEIKANCTEDLVKKLAQIPTKRIVEATYGLYAKLNLPFGELWLMRPSLETNFSQEMFLPGPPWELITSGKIADVPIMIGMTKDSAKLYALADFPKKVEFTRQYDKYVPSDLNITDPKQKKKVGRSLKKFYFHCNSDSPNIEKEFPTLLNDVFIWHGLGLTSVLDGDDLQFIFYSTFYKNKPKPGSIEEEKTKELMEFISNFAKERNPSAIMEVNKVKWEPMGSENKYIDYGIEIKMKKSLWADRLNLWEKIADIGKHCGGDSAPLDLN